MWANVVRSPQTVQKLLVLLAFSATLGLELGNSVRMLVASSMGQSINVTAYTGTRMKKISVKLDQGTKAPVMMKHRGNAAFAALFLPPLHPVELKFAAPSTVASWQFVQVLHTQPQRTWENAPPPLRGPPLSALA